MQYKNKFHHLAVSKKNKKKQQQQISNNNNNCGYKNMASCVAKSSTRRRNKY